MADAELTAEQIEELKQKAEQADYYKTEAEKAFKKRDELKKKLEDEAKAKAEEQGKFKELYESTVPKITEFEKTIEQLRLEKEQALKVKNDFEKEQRESLLKDLPDGDEKEIGSKLDLMDLRKYVELHKKQESKKHNSTSVGGKKGEEKPKTLAEWRKLNS
jgi:hypothetical protein